VTRRSVRVRVVNHRHYRIEVFDERGGGWRLLVHAPDNDGRPEILRNHVPNGLEELLTEARERIDRRLLHRDETADLL